jgi:hypothetical protein
VGCIAACLLFESNAFRERFLPAGSDDDDARRQLPADKEKIS